MSAERTATEEARKMGRAAMVYFGVLAVVQLILHCLGILGILLGLLALLFGNTERGLELIVGGVSFIVLKYVLGFVCIALGRLLGFRRNE
jgi:hypothetical protein